MLRLAAIFVAICIVLVAGGIAAILYLTFGLSGAESATVGIAALTGMLLYNTITTRLRDRNEIGEQIADLSRLTADLAKHMAEIKRGLTTAESKVDGAVNRVRAAIEPVTTEIGDLGVLVKQLADTVAAHEAALAGRSAPPAELSVLEPEPVAPAAPQAAPASAPAASFRALDNDAILASIREAIESNRMDLYLQPIVTLPQRKVRYYEALTRLRTAGGEQVMAEDFVPHAETSGLMPKIDNLSVFRCVQILRRLLMKNRDVGLFCNIASATLGDRQLFQQFTEFMEANRALAPALMFEFRQDAYRAMAPLEHESLAALAARGFRFSMDHVTDLRLDPQELADRGFRFVKVPAAMLLKSGAPAGGDIHPADLSDLLARHHIDLIAERIEHESAVVDLLDFDVRFGQGFLFSQPRPVRAEAMQAANGGNGGGGDAAREMPKPAAAAEPARMPSINDPAAPKIASGIRFLP
jgi:cyclic-di-GMP phosphodiesterase TipF (flagellum assembly factor)